MDVGRDYRASGVSGEYNVNHLRMISAVVHHPEMNLYINPKPFVLTVEVCGQSYALTVEVYEQSHTVIAVTHPFHAIYYPANHQEHTWMWYSESTRCFEPFIDDGELYAELNAAYFANQVGMNAAKFRCLHMPNLSKLRGDMCFMQCSETGSGGGLEMSECCTDKFVSVLRVRMERSSLSASNSVNIEDLHDSSHNKGGSHQKLEHGSDKELALETDLVRIRNTDLMVPQVDEGRLDSDSMIRCAYKLKRVEMNLVAYQIALNNLKKQQLMRFSE